MENTMIAEKQPLTEEYLQKMDAYWRAANYLAAAQLYLLDTGEQCPDRTLYIRI